MDPLLIYGLVGVVFTVAAHVWEIRRFSTALLAFFPLQFIATKVFYAFLAAIVSPGVGSALWLLLKILFFPITVFHDLGEWWFRNIGECVGSIPVPKFTTVGTLLKKWKEDDDGDSEPYRVWVLPRRPEERDQ